MQEVVSGAQLKEGGCVLVRCGEGEASLAALERAKGQSPWVPGHGCQRSPPVTAADLRAHATVVTLLKGVMA